MRSETRLSLLTAVLAAAAACQSPSPLCLDAACQPPSLEAQGQHEARLAVSPWVSNPPLMSWTSLHDEHPWLRDISSWYSHFDHQGTGRMTRRFQGAMGVGDGHVFGLIGLGPTLNTLSNVAGPDYQQAESFFGETQITARVDGRDLGFTEEWAFRTRETAIVGTRARTAVGVEVYTVDFVPPGEGVIVRRIGVVNRDRAAHTVAALARTAFDKDEAVTVVDGMVTQQRGARYSWLAGLGGAVFSTGDEALISSFGSLEPGQERWATVALTFTRAADPGEASARLAALPDPDTLMLATRDHWRSWLRGAAAVQSPYERFDDLYEGLQITVGVQTSADGAVSPMSRYTKAWLRDTLGPSRFFTRIGRADEARAMLDYLYKTSILRGRISNSTELAQDVSQVHEPTDPEAFWAGVDFMPGRNPAEAPSYIPLQYGFLYRHQGDGQLVAERYPYLKRMVTGQQRTEDGLMLFSGDETFRIMLMTALGIWQDPTDVAWSSNSALAYIAALDEVAQLADSLGELGDAAALRAEADLMRAYTDAHYRVGDYLSPALFFRSEQPHPLPFEDVSTKAVFFGAADPDTEDTRAQVGAYVDYLMRDDGTLLTPEGAFGRLQNPGYMGMVPGLFLYNAAKVDHPAAGLAFDAIGLTASPSGNWQEMHWSDHSSASVIYPPSGRGPAEVAARYRPWEGGENIDAALVYLTGAELNWPARHLLLAPHLPEGWGSFSARGMPAGPDGSYDLELERSDGVWSVSLTSAAPEALTVDVRLSEVGGRWGTLTVNGAACNACPRDVVYDEVTRASVTGVELPAGGTLTIVAQRSP